MEWKVYKSQVEVKPHYNADSLDLVVAGEYQFVTQKGIYQTGDYAVVIPEKSILPPEIQKDYVDYLKGPEKNRVGSVRLRGEFSQGILLKRALAEPLLGKSLDEFQEDEDISEILGIKKYEPFIPPQMRGKMRGDYTGYKHKFDCIQFGAYSDNLTDDDKIIVTEKLHGSQINYIYNVQTGEEVISSKGLLSRDIVIQEEEGNLYWQAAKNSNLKSIAQSTAKVFSPDALFIQINGEVIPCQKGYTYGLTQDKPVVVMFSMSVMDLHKEVHFPVHSEVVEQKQQAAPLIAKGRYGDLKDKLRSLSEGMEQFSGKEVHIREGVVVRPEIDRKTRKGNWLRLKIINPKYKESGEEFN